FLLPRPSTCSPLFPYTTLFRSFSMKWNMGWMHDSLNYISQDPIFRKYHHDQLTFGMMYTFTESFQLPFSHDEVVHGKGSMINKIDRKSTRLNSSHVKISYAVFC